jgi:putative transcriptional regulator
MKTVNMKIESIAPSGPRAGRINAAKLDATTQSQIARHATEDDIVATQDAALLKHLHV